MCMWRPTKGLCYPKVIKLFGPSNARRLLRAPAHCAALVSCPKHRGKQMCRTVIHAIQQSRTAQQSRLNVVQTRDRPLSKSPPPLPGAPLCRAPSRDLLGSLPQGTKLT